MKTFRWRSQRRNYTAGPPAAYLHARLAAIVLTCIPVWSSPPPPRRRYCCFQSISFARNLAFRRDSSRQSPLVPRKHLARKRGVSHECINLPRVEKIGDTVFVKITKLFVNRVSCECTNFPRIEKIDDTVFVKIAKLFVNRVSYESTNLPRIEKIDDTVFVKITKLFVNRVSYESTNLPRAEKIGDTVFVKITKLFVKTSQLWKLQLFVARCKYIKICKYSSNVKYFGITVET